MQYETHSDRIIVEPEAAPKKTNSGIIIPEMAMEAPNRGKVVAVGEGKANEKMLIEVGFTVLYSKYAGTPIEDDGKTYLVMRAPDVFAFKRK